MDFLLHLLTAQPLGLAELLPYIVVWGGMFLVMWFFIFRPQKKRQRETQMMQDSLQVGDFVLTNAGFYGKVADVVNDVVVVEFGKNKSVLIPVHKSAINSVSEPDLTIHKEETDDKKAEGK